MSDSPHSRVSHFHTEHVASGLIPPVSAQHIPVVASIPRNHQVGGATARVAGVICTESNCWI